MHRHRVQPGHPGVAEAVTATARRRLRNGDDGQIEVRHLLDDDGTRGQRLLAGLQHRVLLTPEFGEALRVVAQLGQPPEQFGVQECGQLAVVVRQRAERRARRVGEGGERHRDPCRLAGRGLGEVARLRHLGQQRPPGQRLAGGDEGEDADQAVLVVVVVRRRRGRAVEVEGVEVRQGHLGRQVSLEVRRHRNVWPVREAEHGAVGGGAVDHHVRPAGQIPVGHIVQGRSRDTHRPRC